MIRLLQILFLGVIAFQVQGQLVNVRVDYNGVGDCMFTAVNNAKTPLFLNIEFADLQNTTFSEPLPYVKQLEPGNNVLFTLPRYPGEDVPRFNYKIKSYRSDPKAKVNLDFPYLLPFTPGQTVKSFDVANIDGFWGANNLKRWVAVGFVAKPGEPVCAARRGQVVEVVGAKRNSDPESWYNTWNNSITLLQPDGTLMCYRNVVDKAKKLALNKVVHAGEVLGEVAPNVDGIVLLIYHNSLLNDELRFVLPQFVINPGEISLVNPAMDITVVHPYDIRALEMTKRERKKLLKRD